MKRKLLIMLFMLLTSFMTFGCSSETDLVKEKPVDYYTIPVTLAREFVNNDEKAGQKFSNRIIRIAGVARLVYPDGGDKSTTIIEFYDNYTHGMVVKVVGMVTDDNQPNFRKLRKGNMVFLKGVCKGGFIPSTQSITIALDNAYIEGCFRPNEREQVIDFMNKIESDSSKIIL